MIIQKAPEGEKRFISTMVEHNDLCQHFARAFGNELFERPEPQAQVLYTIAHHDRGWEAFDAAPVLDRNSGYPCGLGTAPLPGGLATSTLSPDFNEAHHAYCGLLSSMHSWGLYNGRYGFTEFRARQEGSTSVARPAAQSAAVEAMLAGELARQERLRSALAADPETAPWIEEKNLLRNYKLLQFCDTLALYFHLRPAGEHRDETYVHVPKSIAEDASVSMRPGGGNIYSLAPFPFAGERLEARSKGRYFAAVPPGSQPADLAAALYGEPETEQVFIFVAG